jgi:hypothetical protein
MSRRSLSSPGPVLPRTPSALDAGPSCGTLAGFPWRAPQFPGRMADAEFWSLGRDRGLAPWSGLRWPFRHPRSCRACGKAAGKYTQLFCLKDLEPGLICL